MAYTRAQLTSIMNHRGQAFIPANRTNYAGRVCETYIRKKTYRLEDRAALEQYAQLKAAYGDIQNHAFQLSAHYRLDKLAVDSASLQWRRDLLNYTEQRYKQLSADLAFSAYTYSTQAYLSGYYGRAWLMDEATKPGVKVAHHRLNATDVSRAILTPHLQEALDPNIGHFLYNSAEWRDPFQNALTKAQLTANKALTGQLQVGATPQAAVSTAVGAPLGVTSKPNKSTRGAFYEAQLATRYDVMSGSNNGATRAYKENEDILAGVMFVTSHDNRVCSLCEGYDGTIYIVNDLLAIGILGLPPASTHPGCRCSFIPFILPDVLGDHSAPPDDTFEDWADEYGYSDDMSVFFDDKKLESSMV